MARIELWIGEKLLDENIYLVQRFRVSCRQLDIFSKFRTRADSGLCHLGPDA